MGGDLLVVVVVGVIVGVYLVRRPDRTRRAGFLRRAGFTVMAIFAGFLGLFVVGETFSDPGGWRALALIATWAIPLAAISALAWYRPRWAAPVFAALIAAVIGLSIWFAVDPDGWRSFEDHNGPVRTILTFALAAAVGLYGLKRTGVAGVMLLVLGIVPVTLASAGRGGFSSLAAASLAPVITGTLYVISAATARSNPPPDESGADSGEEAQAA